MNVACSKPATIFSSGLPYRHCTWRAALRTKEVGEILRQQVALWGMALLAFELQRLDRPLPISSDALRSLPFFRRT